MYMAEAGKVTAVPLGVTPVDLRHGGEVHADENGAGQGLGAAAVGGEGDLHAVVGAAGQVRQLRQSILAGGAGAEVQVVAAAVGAGQLQLGSTVLADAVVVIVQAAGGGHVLERHVLQRGRGILLVEEAGDVVGVDLDIGGVSGVIADVALAVAGLGRAGGVDDQRALPRGGCWSSRR